MEFCCFGTGREIAREGEEVTCLIMIYSAVSVLAVEGLLWS
jgi:hypothetical protein